jgi:2-aminoadipate transaminase
MYKEKRNTMFKAMERYFPEEVKWTQPHGGMFLWVTLPEGVDTRVMFEDAIRNNVAYVVGSSFYSDGGVKNTMRLNFTYPSNEEIEEGIKRLADVIKKELEKEKRDLVIGV